MNETMMNPMPMMNSSFGQGAMMAATGFAAGRGLLGASLFRNPLLLLAAGVAVGYLAHKYEKEIIAAASKLMGMGRDFALEQKENLADLAAEAEEARMAEAAAPTAAAPEAPAA